jgi:kynureninase
VLGDWREPDVIRISRVPLYNTFADVLRFARAVRTWRAGDNAPDTDQIR